MGAFDTSMSLLNYRHQGQILLPLPAASPTKKSSDLALSKNGAHRRICHKPPVFRRSKLLSSTLVIVITLVVLRFWGINKNITILNHFFLSRTALKDRRVSPEFCYDPYRLPGIVERSELPEGPIESVQFIVRQPVGSRRLGRHSTGSAPPPFVVPTLSAALLADPEAPEVAFLRNRTVLFVGDSLDRNLVYHLSEETFGPTHHRFLTPEDYPELHSPAIQSHQVGLGVHPKLGTTFANFFLMSVDVEKPEDFFHPGEDPPQRFEGRFETFYNPLLDEGVVNPTPDMVVFNSGLWDLVYLSGARVDEVARNRSMGVMSRLQVTGEPLNEAELDHHKHRFRLLIHSLRARFPDPHTRLVYRTMPDSSLTLAAENSMSRGRVRQIDAANVEVVRSFNDAGMPVDIIDWTWIARELIEELIDLVHFGRGASQWLFGDMVLHHLRRHVLGDQDQTVWSECGRYQAALGNATIRQSRSYFNPAT